MSQLFKSCYQNKSYICHKLLFPKKYNGIPRRYFTSNTTKKMQKSDIEEFYHLIKSQKKDFILICILSGITSGITMLFPHALKGIGHLAGLKVDLESETDSTKTNKDDKAIKQEESKKLTKAEVNKEYLKFLGIWIPIFLVSGGLTYLRRYVSGDIANKIAYRLRYKLYNYLIDKELSFFINKRSNSTDFVHKLANDITTVSNSITLDFSFFLRGAIFLIGSTIYITINSPQLAIASIATMGALTLCTKNISKKMRESKIQETAALTNLSIIAGGRLSNMKLIKANNTENFEKQYYLKALDIFYIHSKDVAKYTGLNFGILDGLGQMAVVGILVYGSYLVSFGYMGSEMIAFSMYSLYAGLGFRSMFNSYTELKKTAGIYSGIRDIIGSVENTPEFTINFEELRKKIQLTDVDIHDKFLANNKIDHPPSIQFIDISFSYGGHEILKKVSFNIEPGTVIALVGASGTGKSTILNLLTKLYEASNGQILIDGKSISDLSPEWIRANVSYITQEPILFMGTIQENIKYGNECFDTSIENITKMAKIAAADEFIEKLPEKYETKIGEKGLTLSGGQRQKIVIARALIKDPKILILDESTSSLDQESEISIIKELKEVCKNRTCLIVTHKIENYKTIINKFIKLGINEDISQEK